MAQKVPELWLPWFGRGFEFLLLQVFQAQALPLFLVFLGLVLVVGCAPVPLPTVSRGLVLLPGSKLSFFCLRSFLRLLKAEQCSHVSVPLLATLACDFVNIAVGS